MLMRKALRLFRWPFGRRTGGPRTPPSVAPGETAAAGGGEPPLPLLPLPPGRPLDRRLGHLPELHRTLALKVLLGHVQNRNQLLEAPPSDLSSVEPAEAVLLIRAMAAAAHANGALDPHERERIRSALLTARLGDRDRQSLETSIDEPPCLEVVLREVASPQVAARVYAVSLTVLEKGTAVNRAYLRYIAHRLAIPADLAVRLNRQSGLPRHTV
jgi:hypothetical protein